MDWMNKQKLRRYADAQVEYMEKAIKLPPMLPQSYPLQFFQGNVYSLALGGESELSAKEVQERLLDMIVNKYRRNLIDFYVRQNGSPPQIVLANKFAVVNGYERLFSPIPDKDFYADLTEMPEFRRFKELVIKPNELPSLTFPWETPAYATCRIFGKEWSKCGDKDG